MMLRPVATFAAAPWLAGASNPWRSTGHMLAALVGSVECATRHYGRPTIYCDALGAEVVQALTGAEVVIAHDDLHPALPPQMWAAAKMQTYAAQLGPFLHFDLDALIFDPLPARVASAAVGAQCLEVTTGRWYDIDGLLARFRAPACWAGVDVRAIRPPNVGVLVINDMTVLDDYCAAWRDWEADNADALATCAPEHLPHPCLLEQHLLGVICARRGVTPEILLADGEPAVSSRYAHFVGALKTDTFATRRLERWMTAQVRAEADHLDSLRCPVT